MRQANLELFCRSLVRLGWFVAFMFDFECDAASVGQVPGISLIL